ncbi:Outer membrane protein beta-barrel domain-containing protein [Pontibacter lucknowensis]|uniref:Outer membrane protein beta-barrel domain-containing protein n=1 Tax=Pontibacter lucknowensis TaxID=1077936 RepID=A0A1N6ZCJ9_9BACT|nr:Outer membrane protein beta-barrel domain-containing protein [Pontibacter lucknowensis]
MSRSRYVLLLLCLITLTVCTTAQAQDSVIRRMGVSKIPERGLVIQAGAGIAAVKSDICGSYDCNDLGPAFSIGALFKYNPFWSISGEVEYLKLGASEKTYQDNITFESRVIEVSGMLVYNLMDSYAGSNNYRSTRKRFAVPFVKGGIGFVYYTPSSYPTNRAPNSDITYDRLRSYPAIAGVIPFGGGIRFRFSDQISIAPEVMYQITTTDYLDNVTRIENTKDHYGVVSVKLLYTPMPKNEVFTSKRQGINPFKKKK